MTFHSKAVTRCAVLIMTVWHSSMVDHIVMVNQMSIIDVAISKELNPQHLLELHVHTLFQIIMTPLSQPLQEHHQMLLQISAHMSRFSKRLRPKLMNARHILTPIPARKMFVAGLKFDQLQQDTPNGIHPQISWLEQISTEYHTQQQSLGPSSLTLSSLTNSCLPMVTSLNSL
jgi:hypothetical protein